METGLPLGYRKYNRNYQVLTMQDTMMGYKGKEKWLYIGNCQKEHSM